jgi:glycolate oxidase FAD binding subunit
MIAPTSLDELIETVRGTPRLLAVGAQSKPGLSNLTVPKVSMIKLRGITEYDPGEFTFTALAGTPVREISVALADRGQYLPFDPMLSDAGATLGGTVASGLSGPGRFRFGGLRDFILGVRFVDGSGHLLRMGSKVVKNAAGFDLPKFFVGSLGRFGVLAEITFKVFPRPASTRTLKIKIDGPEAASHVLAEAARTRWEPDALDFLPDGKTILLRLAAPEPAIDALSREVLSRWEGIVMPGDDASRAWADIREFRWTDERGAVAKVPVTPACLPALQRAAGGARIHFSSGGNAAFLSLSAATQATDLDAGLRRLGLSGMTLRGPAPLWLGCRARPAITGAVKHALDPQDRFPSLDD